jgi:hypothetical protein
MTLAFDFHPEAQAEFAADVDWYDDREAGVGGRFAEAVRVSIDAGAVATSGAHKQAQSPAAIEVEQAAFVGAAGLAFSA